MSVLETETTPETHPATTPVSGPVSLDDRVAAVCGHLNASYATLTELIAEAIATEAWASPGIRSIEHWISWRTGLSVAHARTLVALVAARADHPKVFDAFAAGELSIDQAAVAIQARPEHDDDIAVWARIMTLSQLRIAVRASIASPVERDPDPGDQPAEPTPPEPAVDREYVSMRQDDDGSWRLHGRLDSDHGALIDAALAEARDRLFHGGHHDVTWADALVDIAEGSFDTATAERRERFRVNIFIDPAVSPTATWTNGIAVPDAITRHLTCEGTLSPVFTTNALATSVGRSQRIVPERTRRIVLHRDRSCRNPLCGATRGLEIHHIIHWIDGGPTDTDNLIALCRHCHRAHHHGRLAINGHANHPDGVEFRNEHGHLIDPATHASQPDHPPPTPRHRYRHPLGEHLDPTAIFFNNHRRQPHSPTTTANEHNPDP